MKLIYKFLARLGDAAQDQLDKPSLESRVEELEVVIDDLAEQNKKLMCLIDDYFAAKQQFGFYMPNLTEDSIN
jgi:ATP/maltotriose-dependent transcriptional regulator MalT